jgi:iron complex outermembrane receptor protein
VLTAHLGPLSATPLNIEGQDKEKAYFGQFTADLSRFYLKNVHVTAGYRKTESDSVRTTAAAIVNYPSGYITPGAISTSSTSSEGSGWILSADWKVTPDLLTYVTRRKGYKPGGVNTLVGANTIPGFVPIYGPESVKDIEVGAKWDFRLMGMRGRLNADFYRNDFTNIQRGFSAVNAAGNSAVFTANVAAARLQGFEAEGFIQPVDGLRVSATYAFTDARYTKWQGSDPINIAPPGTILDLSDMPFANAPKNKYSLSIQYDLPLDPQIGTVTASATVFGQSRVFFNDQAFRFIEAYGPGVLDAVSEPGYAAANARIDWTNIYGKGVDVGVFVRNITDEIYAYAGGVQLHSVGIASKLYNEPRTYGIELTYRFGQ